MMRLIVCSIIYIYIIVITIISKKVITFAILFKERWVTMKNTTIIPEPHTATEFLRGQASKIFEDVASNDNVVIVNKNSRPKNVIISYERYKRLKENGADI